MTQRHTQQALLLSRFTVTYNVLEAVVSVVFALYAWLNHVRGEKHDWNPQRSPLGKQ